MVQTQMLPVFDALFDFEDLQSSFHSTNEMGRCLGVELLFCKDPILDALAIPQGVSFGNIYTSGAVVFSNSMGEFPLARKCLMHCERRT
jgi:hypothetical protein